MWSELYRPVRVEQMIGNEDVRLIVLKWISGWVVGSRPLLLIGPPGVGKTSLVHILAGQFDYDLIEMNASDTRSKEDLEHLIMPMLMNASIFGKRMLLFLDEIDGISGREDTGGIDSIVNMMKEPAIPVIMAANKHDTKLKELAKVSKVISFNPVPPRLLMLFLDRIIKKEKMNLSSEEKNSIVYNSRGDIRSLLNNAQSKSFGYEGVRPINFQIDIATAIEGFFSSDRAEIAREFLLNADATYQNPRFGMSTEERRKDKLNALFSSVVSSRIDPDSLAAILDILSKADIIVGRVGENRQWSLLKYIDNIIAYGLFDTTHYKQIKYNQYSMSWPVMGPIFIRGRSMKNLLSEMAYETHTSKSVFGSLYFPYLIQIMIDNKIDPYEFAEHSNLDEKTGEALAKEIDRTKKKEVRSYSKTH
jgi:replication factor C large subunit